MKEAHLIFTFFEIQQTASEQAPMLRCKVMDDDQGGPLFTTTNLSWRC